MRNRFKKAGISMAALVITLVVLVIITATVVIPGISASNQARLATFYSNVQTVQDLVAMQLVNNEVDITHKNDSRYKWAGVIEGYVPELGGQPFVQQIEGINVPVAQVSRELLKNTNLQGAEKNKYYIDMKGVVYYEGFVLNGNTYYNKDSMVDDEVETGVRSSIANVQGFTGKRIGSTLVIQDIATIKYEFSIDGGQTWQESTTFSNVQGEVTNDSMLVRLVDGLNNEIGRGIVEVTDENILNGEYSSVKGVNTPDLLDGMVGVYWDEEGNEVTSDSDNFSYYDWYSYEAQIGTNDGKTSRWANAKTADGNYWVWIPRYEYRITNGLHGDGLTYTGTGNEYRTAQAGTIDVKFVQNLSTIPTSGYRVHPAFTVGNNEIPGMWVAKYQVSMQSNNVKIIPGQAPKRYISLADCFTKSYNYDRAKESHLTKNIEWGAMVYLTHSQYGRNGNEVSSNMLSNKADILTASNTDISTTESGLYSSTGNRYGIYDIAGGFWDYVAAGVTSGVTSKFGADKAIYYDCYDPLDKENNDDNYGKYNGNVVYGDAFWEVSKGTGWWDNGARKDLGKINTGWFSDFSCVCSSEENYIQRGGSQDRKKSADGIFSSASSTADVREDVGYRIVLWGSLE